MRRFTLGAGTDRKIVVIEIDGTKMTILKIAPDGSKKRSGREFRSEAEARSASDQTARELISRGYAEPVGRPSKPAKMAAAAPKPAARVREHEEAGPVDPYDEIEAAAAPVLTRLASAPSSKPLAGDGPVKKKKTGANKKKKKKQPQDGDALDKRVLAGVGAVGIVLIGVFGFVAYDSFIKPPTIVGVWRGSMVEHEISKSLTHTKYDLVLDEKKRAALHHCTSRFGVDRGGRHLRCEGRSPCTRGQRRGCHSDGSLI